MSSSRETFKDILEDNIEGMSREEVKYYIENDAIPDSGSVSGLIYYSEIGEIARNHWNELVDIIRDNGYTCDMSQNDMVWTAWSIILPEL